MTIQKQLKALCQALEDQMNKTSDKWHKVTPTVTVEGKTAICQITIDNQTIYTSERSRSRREETYKELKDACIMQIIQKIFNEAVNHKRKKINIAANRILIVNMPSAKNGVYSIIPETTFPTFA